MAPHATSRTLSILEPILEHAEERLDGPLPTTLVQGAFPTPSNNTSNKRQRLGFQCERCPKAYGDKRSLVRHQRTSTSCSGLGTGNRLFLCTFCPQGFSRDDIRKRHEKERHLNKKRTPSRADLSDHEASLGTDTPPQSSDPFRSSVRGAVCNSLDSSVPSSGRPSWTREFFGHELEVGSFPEPDGFSRPWTERLGNISSTYTPESRNSWSITQAIIAPVQGPVTEPKDVLVESNTAECGLDIPGTGDSLDTPFQGQCPQLASTVYSHIPTMETVAVSATQQPANATGEDTIRTECTPTSPEHKSEAASQSRHLEHSNPRFDTAPISLPYRPLSQAALLKRGASRPASSSTQMFLCPLCREPFGHNVEAIQRHIGQHVRKLASKHVCDLCNIAFVHVADLHYHLQCAARGHCGINFKHVYECKGHHPPDSPDEEFLVSENRNYISERLLSWELAQLHAFNMHIAALDVQAMQKTLVSAKREYDSWSLGALRQAGRSVTSLGSSLAFHSAPDCFTYQVDSRLLARAKRGASKAVVPLSKDQYARKLIVASLHGNMRRVAELIELGADPNRSISVEIVTPLAVHHPLQLSAVSAAVLGQHHDILDRLLSANGDWQTSIVQAKSTPALEISVDADLLFGSEVTLGSLFSIAIAHGDCETLELFVSHGARVEDTSLLGDVFKRDEVKTLSFLLDRGAIQLPDGRDPSMLMLQNAVACQSVQAVRRLLSHTLCHFQNEHDSILEVTIQSGSIEILQLLLDHGLRAEDHHIQSAVRHMAPEALPSLLRNSEHISPWMLQELLLYGVEYDQEELLDVLIAMGSNLSGHICEGSALSCCRAGDEVATHGRTCCRPIVAASQHEQWDVVKKLLQAGADVNTSCAVHGTALYSAAESACIESMTFLLSRNADPNISGGLHSSPLGAIAGGHLENRAAMSLLLRKGADPNVQNGMPLCAAVRGACDDAVHQLLAAGATLLASSGLQGAIESAVATQDDLQVILTLVKAGLDVNTKLGTLWSMGNLGNLLCAVLQHFALRRNGHATMNIVTGLVEAGADISAQVPSGNALMIMRSIANKFRSMQCRVTDTDDSVGQEDLVDPATKTCSEELLQYLECASILAH